MNEIYLIYVTHPDKEHAEKISQILIDKKLIACSNIFPINSCYFWNDKMENDKEWVSINKTIPDLIDPIKNIISEHHKYEVPCILNWGVEANEKYYNWVVSECSSKKS